MVLTLYRARFSTNVERVALTLALKGLEAESVWIGYDDRSPVEAVSGQGLVPVLDYNGEILIESMDIVRELDRRHPEPPLFAERPFDILTFIDWFNGTWKGPPNDRGRARERRAGPGAHRGARRGDDRAPRPLRADDHRLGLTLRRGAARRRQLRPPVPSGRNRPRPGRPRALPPDPARPPARRARAAAAGGMD